MNVDIYIWNFLLHSKLSDGICNIYNIYTWCRKGISAFFILCKVNACSLWRKKFRLVNLNLNRSGLDNFALNARNRWINWGDSWKKRLYRLKLYFDMIRITAFFVSNRYKLSILLAVLVENSFVFYASNLSCPINMFIEN